MTPLLREAQRVRAVPGLSDRLLGRATGASPSTVRDWFAGRTEPTGSRAERLIEVAEMVRQLGEVMEPAAIPVWLQRPIPRLENERPVDLLGRGEYLPVARLIGEMQYSGVS